MSKIFESLIATTKTSQDQDTQAASKGVAAEAKGGASLFDSMLSELKIPKSDEKIQTVQSKKESQSQTESKVTDKSGDDKQTAKNGIEVLKNDSKTNTSLVKEKIVPDQTVAVKPEQKQTPSLMDTLIDDAAQQISKKSAVGTTDQIKQIKDDKASLQTDKKDEVITKQEYKQSTTTLKETIENLVPSKENSGKQVSNPALEDIKNEKANKLTQDSKKEETATKEVKQEIKEDVPKKLKDTIEPVKQNDLSKKEHLEVQKEIKQEAEKPVQKDIPTKEVEPQSRDEKSLPEDEDLIKKVQSKLNSIDEKQLKDNKPVQNLKDKSIEQTDDLKKDETIQVKDQLNIKEDTKTKTENIQTKDSKPVKESQPAAVEEKLNNKKENRLDSDLHNDTKKIIKDNIEPDIEENEPKQKTDSKIKPEVEDKSILDHKVKTNIDTESDTAQNKHIVEDKQKESKNLFANNGATQKIIEVEPDIVLKNENILKDDVKEVKPKGESLLDKLIDDSLNIAKTQEQKAEQNKPVDKHMVQKPTAEHTTLQNNTAPSSKEPLFANIYMGTQKHINELTSLQQKAEGKSQAKNGTSLKDIQKSATTLDLDPTNMEVKHEHLKNEQTLKNNDKMLNRLAFTKNIMNEQLDAIDELVAKQSKETVTVRENNNAVNQKVVEVNVAAPAVQTIQNRIIGAKQHMSQMMSDIARQMVENYKPPLTAFRINLNPNGLGHIAVLMKSEKDSGLSISLNMSNSATLDAMVDNQNSLRGALGKSFENQTNFSLDFGMQNDANDQNKQNNKNSQDQSSKQSDNNDEVDTPDNSDYM